MRIKNWRTFQHYKHRNPPWIKLHRTLLDDREWFNLSGDASKMLACCWLLASERDGKLPKVEDIAFRLRITTKKAADLILELKHWVEVDASTTLAPRKQHAITESESESEKKDDAGRHLKEKKEKRTAEVVPINETPQARTHRLGKPILISLGVSERNSGAIIGRWLKQKNDPAGILAALEYAAENGVAEPIGYVTRCLAKEGKHEKLSLGDKIRIAADRARELENNGNPSGPPFDFGSS